MSDSSPAAEPSIVPLTPRHRVWRVNIFIITWLTYAGYYFCRKPFSQAKTPLAHHMQIGDAELANIGTALLLAYMIGQFLTAWLAKSIRCKTLALAGMGVSALSTVVMGQVVSMGPDAYEPFLGLMLVNGLAQGTGWGACIGILAHWYQRKERGTVLAFWATCYMLGSVLAKTFSSMMLGLDTQLNLQLKESLLSDISFVATEGGIAAAFGGAGAVLGLIWLTVFIFVKDRPEDYGMTPIVDETHAVESEDKVSFKLGWTRDVWRTVLMMGGAYFCFKFVRYALDSWSPRLIEATFGQATDIAGYQSAAFDLGGFLGVICAGYVTDRFFKSRRTTVMCLMTFGMLASMVYLSQIGGSSATLFVLGLALVGFMLAGPDSLLSGVGSIDAASKRGAVVAAAIINGIGSLGSVVQEQALGHALGNATSQEAGLNAVLLILLTASGVGLFITLILAWWTRQGRTTL